MTYRDSRSTNQPDIQAAPRFVDAYVNPFIQWPPARTDHPLAARTAGTFDSLRISDQVALPAPSAPAAPALIHHQQPWRSTAPVDPRLVTPYGQVFPGHHLQQPAMVIRPVTHHQQLALPHAAHATQPTTFALVPVQDPRTPQCNEEPYRCPPELSRTLSIDAITINAAPITKTSKCPQRLTITEKVMAFLGNDQLMSRHALRQNIKRGPYSSSC